ncbi:glycosyltransferase [Flavobacterium sp.]|uniref:glycosyltransferase n=1 Tax=Flavobacterium sp. TaxID=239 RepID=UPI003F6A3542
MNIVLFLEQSFDPHAGGAQRSTSKLAEIFKYFGHNVVLISSSNKPSVVTSWLDIPIYHINTKKDKLLFKQILDEKNISVILNNAGESMTSTKFLLNNKANNIKIINLLRINPSNFYDNHKDYIGLFFSKRNLGFLNNFIVRKLWLAYHILRIRNEFNYIINNTEAFVMLSDRFKEDLYSLAPGLRKYHNKIYGITNPFECPKINIQQTIAEKENIILFVGRLHIVQKRVDLLMEVWKKLHETFPEWKFWVVGFGDSKSMMENYCLQNKLDRVTFFGKDNPNDYYKKAKIFHMTSAFEGFGNVLIEAQSYGCVPILFNSYSAAPDIVTDKINGILVDPFNIDRYVNETKALINNSERLNKMALNAYENVSRFSYEKTYEKWVAVFKSMH